ncbi:unnamed protein product [Ilex paraguariensis]|uniref:Uncharacterized protein n=1 Tax=Ilex paraguariensis TaxID=185542 RepID=A0ABC8QZN0_9AQUA
MKLHSLFQEYKCFSPSAFATNPSTMRNASSGVDEDEMDEVGVESNNDAKYGDDVEDSSTKEVKFDPIFDNE